MLAILFLFFISYTIGFFLLSFVKDAASLKIFGIIFFSLIFIMLAVVSYKGEHDSIILFPSLYMCLMGLISGFIRQFKLLKRAAAEERFIKNTNSLAISYFGSLFVVLVITISIIFIGLST